MLVPRCPAKYPLEERVYDAVMENGGFILSPGAKALGYDAKLREHIEALASHKRPDGTPLLRQQKNNASYLVAPILTLQSTASFFYGTAPERTKVELQDTFAEAAKRGMAVVEELAGYVRGGAGGKEVHKAPLVWFGGVHSTNAIGEPHVHVHLWITRAGIGPGFKTLSLNDQRAIGRAWQRAEHAAQLWVANELEQRYGLKVEMRNGKVAIPEFENRPEFKLLMGGRKRQIDEYLKEHNLRSTPRTRAYAQHKTRPKKVKVYKNAERHQAWTETAGTFVAGEKADKSRTGMWGRMFQSFVKSVTTDGASVLTVAVRKAFVKRNDKYVVRNVQRFLEDTRKRTRKEGHRAALRELHRRRANGLNDALRIAEEGYRKGRQPRLKLGKGTRIVVTSHVAKTMTAEQKKELQRRAWANGWKLTVAGEQQRQEEQQRQRRQTP